MATFTKFTSSTTPDNDLLINLSLIESGCIVSSIGENLLIFLKDTESKLKSLINFENIKLVFETINRPEFPSVNFQIRFKSKNNLSFRYEYFFNLESDEDCSFMTQLLELGKFELYLLNSDIKETFIVNLEDIEAIQLSNCIG